MEEEKYKLTPKGLFITALCDTHLVEDLDDWRIDAAWSIFQLMMEQAGYVDNEGEE